jgi:DNA-binding transcriptional LysR family regulator
MQNMDMKNKFDIADLQAFDAVARLGVFSKAADSLHLSQPALSRRIDKLEAALGFGLFERTTRRVNLTAAGRDFSRKTQTLLSHLDEMLLDVADIAATRMGEVSIACVHSAAWHYLPPILAKFYEAYPRIKVKVMDGSANEVLTDVTKGHADLGINFMGAQESDIEFETLLDERFVLACRRDHPLAAKSSVAWRELKIYHLIGLAKSSGNRLVLDLALAKVAERPHIFYEAQHVQAQLGMVEAGIGVATVPASALQQNLTTPLVGVPLTSPVVERKLGLITRRARALSPAAQLFKSILLLS